MCFVEQKTFSVILRIFFTNAPPLWFPLYFGLQKCWRWQFLLKIVEEYGQIFYADLKVIIMCFVEQKSIFCDITYFPHKCATFVVPFVFWFTKMLTLTIFTQNRWWVWQNVSLSLWNYFLWYYVFSSEMRHLCVPFVFWFTKCWRWQFLLKIGVWPNFLYR